MSEIETSRVLFNEEIDNKYPGLKAAVQRASRATTSMFRELRSDSNITRPPLLLCDADQLNQAVNKAMQDSEYESDLKRQYAHFQPLEGVIYGAKEEIQDALQKGKEGFRRISLVMAEEYIHAFSTRADGDRTHCGFIVIPARNKPHGLMPGKIYDHDLRRQQDIEEQTQFEQIPITIPVVDQRLTENSTNLAIHLMLSDILPDLGKDFPYLILYKHIGNQPIIIPKNPSLLRTIVESLYSGQRELLQKPFNGELLKLLESPGTKVASLSRIKPTSTDDFFI